MNKYQELNKLFLKMTKSHINDRLKIFQQILNEKLKWALLKKDFNINNEFKKLSDNCNEKHKKRYNFKLIKLFSEKPYEISQ